MKIQLDTTNKTIKVEENVKVLDLINLLKKLLPKDYEQFILETHTSITYWNEPIIIKHYPYYDPWRSPWYYNATMNESDNKMLTMNANKNTAEYTLKDGVFNIDAEV